MKIWLIYPYFIEQRIHSDEIAAVPMGLYYIGAMLKSHGHAVEILNWHARPDAPDAIRRALAAGRPDLIGFSILHANRWGAIEIARTAKALDPDVPVVFGGVGATFLWQHLLTHFEQIDYIVLGEGEFTLLKLVQALESGAPAEQLAAIPGLALRSPAGPVKTAQPEHIQDLDALPRLGRDQFQAEAEMQHKTLEQRLPDVDLREMLLAFKEVMRRADMFSRHRVQLEPLSVRERMSLVLGVLNSNSFTDFTELFEVKEGRLGVVVTFLAILELIRESLIILVQADSYGPIHVKAVSD
ncbi:MAG: segregation/condensation protein A [Gammaproteobacteria bacterium]